VFFDHMGHFLDSISIAHKLAQLKRGIIRPHI